MLCKICGHFETEEPVGFSRHLQRAHGVRAEDYTVKYICEGKRPLCLADGCENETRYFSYGFKRYCKEHFRIAEAQGGKIKRKGVCQELEITKTKEIDVKLDIKEPKELMKFDPSWRTGKTKHDTPSIMKQSLHLSGDNNPWRKMLENSPEEAKEVIERRKNDVREKRKITNET